MKEKEREKRKGRIEVLDNFLGFEAIINLHEIIE